MKEIFKKIASEAFMVTFFLNCNLFFFDRTVDEENSFLSFDSRLPLFLCERKNEGGISKERRSGVVCLCRWK